MAAIAHPRPHVRGGQSSRPQLRVIDGGARSSGRQSSSVYLRRRIAVAVLFVIVIVAACAAIARAGVGPLAAPAVATPAPPLVTAGMPSVGMPSAGMPSAAEYVVQPGDTWWSIVRRLHPAGDPRPMVDRLVARHGAAALQVGERILLDG
jgi:hypothetical protein